MIGDCLNYKIAIQWLSSRPIGVPFARCVTTLGPDRKRDRIKSITTKIGRCSRSRSAGRSAFDRVESITRTRFTLECEGKVTLRVLIHGNHWSLWCTEAGLTVCCWQHDDTWEIYIAYVCACIYVYFGYFKIRVFRKYFNKYNVS